MIIDTLLRDINLMLKKQLALVLQHPTYKSIHCIWVRIHELVKYNLNRHYVFESSSSNRTHLITQLHKIILSSRFNQAGAVPFSMLLNLDTSLLQFKLFNKIASLGFVPIVSSSQMICGDLFHYQIIAELAPCFIKTSPPHYLLSISKLVNTDLLAPANNKNQPSLINLLFFCRIIHCIKMMLRNMIGMRCHYEMVKLTLSNWLLHYCSQLPNHTGQPIKSHDLDITPSESMNGYHCILFIELHHNDEIIKQHFFTNMHS